MQFSFSLSAVLLGLASSVAAQAFPNNTQEFLLKSTVISGPVKFDNLCRECPLSLSLPPVFLTRYSLNLPHWGRPV